MAGGEERRGIVKGEGRQAAQVGLEEGEEVEEVEEMEEVVDQLRLADPPGAGDRREEGRATQGTVVSVLNRY